LDLIEAKVAEAAKNGPSSDAIIIANTIESSFTKVISGKSNKRTYANCSVSSEISKRLCIIGFIVLFLLPMILVGFKPAEVSGEFQIQTSAYGPTEKRLPVDMRKY